MSTQIQRRRGTTTEHGSFTGALAELTVDTTKDTVVVHDGTQVGGFPLLREDGSNSALALGSAGTPSLKFTGDTNTGIYSPGADQLAISTNGVGRLFINSSGQVGINTATPDCVFGIHDTQNGTRFHFDRSTYTNIFGGFNHLGDSGGFAFYNVNSSVDRSIRFLNGTSYAGLTERMRLDSSGRLGLGTSSVASLLHLASSGPVLTLQRSDSASPGCAIHFTNNTGGVNWQIGTNQAVGGSAFEINAGNQSNNRFVITSAGAVGIGTTSPQHLLDCTSIGRFTGNANSAASGSGIEIGYDSSSTSGFIQSYNRSTSGYLGTFIDGANVRFQIAGTEKARFDTSGRLLVGTSTARANFFNGGEAGVFQVEGTSGTIQSLVGNANSDSGNPAFVLAKSRGTSVGSTTVLQSGDRIGRISFQGSDGTEFVQAADIYAEVDGTPGANDMPGRLVFSTTPDSGSSPVERVRITNVGNVLVGCTALPSSTVAGLQLSPNINSVDPHRSSCGTTTTSRTHFEFSNGNGIVGSISTNGSATAYNTSSDYRLKENVVQLTGAVDRLNQLQVHRFNFIADPDTTVDGFIAHEAQAVVPECVTGEKDAVDDDGNPVYQGIDQSKLVPLLTAALQEALQKIETLEQRLNDAGIA